MSLQHLTIQVTFLTGRYHGEDWPPSPARLYQAMIAGVMTCGYRRYGEMVEPALRWLEKQAPPVICACEIVENSGYRIAVPNNDMDVTAAEWSRGKFADPAALRTMKDISPKEVRVDGPHVQYVWQVDAAEAERMTEPLRTAVRCVHTLGWGIDMAFADIREATKSTFVYRPATSGTRFALPMEGTLEDLYTTYQRFKKRTASGGGVDTYTRPSMLRVQSYRASGDVVRPEPVLFFLMKPGGEEIKAVAWEDCMRVAGWMRHAAAQRLATEYDPQFIQEYVQGHCREAEKAHRLSYVPLPSIFGRYGDGMIRRVLIVEPPEASGEVSRMLRFKLTGRVVLDREGRDACSLAPRASDDATFERYIPRGAAMVWRSVTPVVLHGFNADRRGTISTDKTERLLVRAFEMAGYTKQTIGTLAFQTAPWFPGTRHASAMRVPQHLDGYPRVHVEVRFRRAVKGPVLAGIGRHYGIGLFATVDRG